MNHARLKSSWIVLRPIPGSQIRRFSQGGFHKDQKRPSGNSLFHDPDSFVLAFGSEIDVYGHSLDRSLSLKKSEANIFVEFLVSSILLLLRALAWMLRDLASRLAGGATVPQVPICCHCAGLCNLFQPWSAICYQCSRRLPSDADPCTSGSGGRQRGARPQTKCSSTGRLACRILVACRLCAARALS